RDGPRRHEETDHSAKRARVHLGLVRAIERLAFLHIAPERAQHVHRARGDARLLGLRSAGPFHGTLVALLHGAGYGPARTSEDARFNDLAAREGFVMDATRRRAS
ncbi:MAG: hypothetical protein ACRDKJ_04650, partial [Actinomycetota bacterium]